MHSVGAYISYSELFDRSPTWTDIVARLEGLNRLHTVMLLSRLNSHLRHSLQEPGKKGFGWVQGFLVRNFIDDPTLRTLQEKYPLAKMEDRPIFHPLQILNLLRVALAVCSGDDTQRADENEALRFQLGTACLLMNDLLLRTEEELAITRGAENERATQFMVQMLAPYEVSNPANPRNLLFRSHVLFRLLLQNQSVRDDIKMRCNGFDIHEEFRRIANIEVNKWLSLVFAAYAYYMARPVDELIKQPQFFVINRTAFIRESAVTQEEMNSFLDTISIGFNELCNTIGEQRPVDPRFDLVPFRSRPLYVLTEGNFACIDTAFLLEKMYNGVHWAIHDGISRPRRKDLFAAWGRLFEQYVDWLFAGTSTGLPAAYFPFPKWLDGTESFDGAFREESLFVPMEYKGGFLSQEAKYSGKAESLIDELELKIVPGCEQLASKIGLLFHQDLSERKVLPAIPLQDVTRVLPVLIVQDHALRGLFINWWLGRRFRDLMGSRRLASGLEVLPLNVVNIEDLERLIESADSDSFDFVSALHNKAVRDPEMKYQLHNFLLGSPGYGRHESARWNKILAELKEVMFSYTFPGRLNEEPKSP